MKETGHIGNAKVWEKVICNMKLFDKKLSTRYFQEIDIKYVGKSSVSCPLKPSDSAPLC